MRSAGALADLGRASHHAPLARVLGMVYERIGTYHDFRGLVPFKDKFRPSREPSCLADRDARDRRPSPWRSGARTCLVWTWQRPGASWAAPRARGARRHSGNES